MLYDQQDSCIVAQKPHGKQLSAKVYRNETAIFASLTAPQVARVWCLLKKALSSREEPDTSLSNVNSKAHLHLLYSLLSSKHGTLNTCSNDFIQKHIEHVMSHKHEIPSGTAMRGEGGVAGEGKLVDVPCKFSLPGVIAAMF